MRTGTSIVLLGIVTACSAEAPAPGPVRDIGPDPGGRVDTAPPSGAPTAINAQPASIAANIARLRALQLFEVEGVVESAPYTTNCYSLPCDSPAARLAAFADGAEWAARLPTPTEGIDAEATADHLNFLRRLTVVTIGDLLVEQPKNNVNCYNLPCAEDIHAAEAVNQARRGQIANIAGAF